MVHWHDGGSSSQLEFAQTSAKSDPGYNAYNENDDSS